MTTLMRPVVSQNASFRALIEKYKKEAAEDERKKTDSKRQSPGRVSKTKAPISSAISQPKPQKDAMRERAASEVRSTRNTRATAGEAAVCPLAIPSITRILIMICNIQLRVPLLAQVHTSSSMPLWISLLKRSTPCLH